jgi:hypothetical protein
MEFKKYLGEGVSGKALETLTNMVAIARRPEEIANTLEIVNKAEKNKLILPIHAKRMRKELEQIRRSL